MSNATIANRLAFQNSVTNGNTVVTAIPNGTATIARYELCNNSDPTNSSVAQISANGSTGIEFAAAIKGTGTYLPMTFYTGGSERVRIDTSGNLGVGTSTASFKITNNFDAPATWGNDAANFIEMWQNSGTNALGVAMGDNSIASFTTNNGYNLVLATDGVERMRVATSTGNVGIGTASPDAKLTVNGAASFSDGTASAPGIANSGDLDTGVYFPAANEVAVTTGGTVAAAFNSNGLFFRNRIINGEMRIDQRNAGASVTPTSSSYTLDRWQAIISQSSKFSVQQNAGSVTPPTGFNNYLGVTSLSAFSVAAGDYFAIYQQIEGLNVADLGFGTANALTVTISFWVRSSLTGTFGGSLKNSSTRSYPFTYTISSANTWEKKTITIAGDTTGTWPTDTSAGLLLSLGLGVGATFSGTAGAWAGANYVTATGATSVVGTNGATFYITGVQIETGSVATPFERRPYGTELMLCQRYFQQITAGGIGSAYTTAAVGLGGQFPVAMRATPTASLTGALKVDQIGVNSFTQSSSNITSISGGNSATAWSAAFGNFSGMTAFSPVTISDSGSTSKLRFDIEL
jgi:hypothetical protein